MTDLICENYKEPLKKIPEKEGFGYYGVIMTTKNKNLIQCHICGKLFRTLGKHIRTHGMDKKIYKWKFGLQLTNPLSSESEIENRRARFHEWNDKLSPKQKRVLSLYAYSKRKTYRGGKGWTQALEHKNKLGTCRDQLIDSLKKVSEKMGRTPSPREYIKETGGYSKFRKIQKTFGKWSTAIKEAGLPRYSGKYAKTI